MIDTPVTVSLYLKTKQCYKATSKQLRKTVTTSMLPGRQCASTTAQATVHIC